MRAVRISLIIAAALLLAPRAAFAATSCGTLVTNTATITMWSGPIDQIGYTLSYNVTATVKIICPITAVNKYAKPQVVSSGGVVTFYICIDNQRMSADGSVWNVTVTDRLPYGMALDIASMTLDNYGVGALANTDIAWSPNGAANSWTLWSTSAPPAGQAAPFYLRWRIPRIGVLASGCVSYRATVQ
jgi:uncharacterized repeat protein (TIGR01451 family)